MRYLSFYLQFSLLLLIAVLSAVKVADATPAALNNDLDARGYPGKSGCWKGCPSWAKCVGHKCVCSDDKCPRGQKCQNNECKPVYNPDQCRPHCRKGYKCKNHKCHRIHDGGYGGHDDHGDHGDHNDHGDHGDHNGKGDNNGKGGHDGNDHGDNHHA